MKGRKNSITAQTLIIVCAMLLLVNIFLGVFLLSRSKMLMKKLINQRMLDIANTAADMMDGGILEKITKESEGTPDFQRCYETLKVFQDNIDLEYIYAVRDMKDGTFVFIVDPAEDDPGEYGQTVKVTEALQSAAGGVAAADREPYEDSWGKFYSAYSPVFNDAGSVAAIVCVDFDAVWYENQLSANAVTVVLFSVFSLIIGASVVVVLTSRLRKRLRSYNDDLGGLTKDLDCLLQEINIGAEKNGGGLSGDGSRGEVDEIGELEKRIRSIRSALRRYIDYIHSQANSMITALASVYKSVYYINLDTGEGVCYRIRPQNEMGLSEGEHFPYQEVFARYARQYVSESDRTEFLEVIRADNIRRELGKEPSVTHRYLTNRNGQEIYEMIRVTAVSQAMERENADAEIRDASLIHAVSVGFADVDRETRETLAQRQTLSDALSAAEEANRAKTTFLSNMSHEIRTPMNAIIGLDSIALSDSGLTPRTREYLEKIGASARHLLGLINDILDMSRIESGRVTLKNEEFSFASFLEQINAIADSQCRDKGLSYECLAHGELSDYYIGDDMKLKQVIINILGNAVKFTQSGGSVTLVVEKVARYKGKAALRFTIRDTGIGMDKAFLPKLFDAFSQEDSAVSNKYGSTGLGMAITKNIVELMNGKIEVESKKGVGTTFMVTVTLRESGRQDAVRRHGFHPLGLRVLVIDDDSVSCEHARLVLEKAGISAETAASGAVALEMVKLRYARREVYDVILVDWKMPEMDGLETARQIRAILGGESAIIILTAYNWDDILNEAVSAGVNSFLSKPLSVSGVLEEFQSTLDKKPEGKNVRKASLEGRRILLAEDMEINAEIMLEILRMRGMEADHAENGRIAVERFASHPENWYDAVLMDMRMPEMDGLEATAAIRAISRADAQTIPIIALTANAFDEDVQRSLQSGLNAHLSKPVEPESLFETLESLIKE